MERGKVMRTFFAVTFLLISLQIFAQKITLENERLKAVFNEKSGVLEKLIDKQTNWNIQHRPELGLSFYMNVPLENQRFNPIIGTKQNVAKILFDQTEKKITFTWKGLVSEKGGKLDIEFKGTAQLTEEGLAFTGEVINRSPFVIEIIRWPQIGDLSIPDKEKTFSQSGIDYGGMSRFNIYPKFQNEPGYFAVDNPQNWMEFPYTPFVLLSNEKQGLYVGYHDTTVRDLVQFKTEMKPGYVSYELWDTGVNPKGDSLADKPVHYVFYTTHFPFVQPKETLKLHPVVIQAYQGTWHKGADIYKAWRKSWFKAPPSPGWFKEVHSWQQIHMNNPEDDIRYSYKDLLTIAEDCAQNGVKAIQITGWTKGGQDRDNPSHDIDPRLGTREDLRNAISEAQKLGVKMILFTKFTWADRSTKWYRDELIKYGTKDPYGDPHYYNGYAYQTDVQLAEINTRHFTPMCHLSAAWRQIADEEFTKTINLGADGMLYDENQHHGGAKYCYDSSHGHKIPAYIFGGDELLAKGFEKIKNVSSPGYIFGGGGNYDLEFRQYHYSYFRVDPGHVPIHRYVAPHEEMITVVAGYNDRNLVNTALLNRYIISYEPRNFKGRLMEFPMTVAYGNKVDALRRQYTDYLWQGTFHHIVGAKVTADGAPYENYAVFTDDKTGRRAVVIVNYDYEKSIKIHLKLDGRQGKLYSATPEKPEAVPFSGRATIPSNSALIVIEK